MNTKSKQVESQLDCDYDIVISGGGVVGCLAALALGTHKHLKIALLEAGMPQSSADKPSPNTNNQHQHAGFDARVIALAHESLKLMKKIGVDIDSIKSESIQQIHVSDRGHIGQVRLSANEYNLPQLGKVVSIDALGEQLLKQVKALTNVDCMCPASISAAQQHPDFIELSINKHEQITTKLLLVSDGGNSSTRELLGFKPTSVDYLQSAIVTNVKMQKAHNNIAYERFTSQGPIAFLPMHTDDSSGHAMSVVWCMKTKNLPEIMALSEAEFLQRLRSLFGDKLGNITASVARFSYPLTLTYVPEFTTHRAICIGNAAQSLHPIAGQGFNLGVRDVSCLVDAILNDDHEYKDTSDEPYGDAVKQKRSDVGCFANTHAYAKARKSDKSNTITATDTLVRTFSNQYLPSVIGRNLGLLAMNKSEFAKQTLANFAMGKRKETPMTLHSFETKAAQKSDNQT